MKSIYVILLAFAVGIHVDAQNISLELFAEDFGAPVDITHAGDDRLFVVEKSGVIRIISKEGNLFPTPFLDIDSSVKNGGAQSEQGLLGLAFHPDYATNGYLFLNYIDNEGYTNIVRYEVDSFNENLVNPNTKEVILMIDQPFVNHNGGCLKFGPDGMLYIGMGDGGSGNDPINAGQRTDTFLGKMLRIDVDNGLPYTIPEDNPFVDDDDVLDEIWATGLRNPWRFSFDRETGDLWIGDVGQNEIEEIDFQPSNSLGGENYGWRCYEGKQFTNNSSMNDCQETYTEPVYEIFHDQNFQGPCSITGGYVYRGSKYIDLIGKYIFADYCSGDFYIIESDGQGGWDGLELGTKPHNVSSFGEDKDGELYMVSYFTGDIYRVVGETVSIPTVIPNLEEFSVHPNPTLGRTELNLKSRGALEIEVQLIDVNGKVMFTKPLKINGSYSEILDLEGFASGTYLLNITSESGLVSKRLIVF